MTVERHKEQILQLEKAFGQKLAEDCITRIPEKLKFLESITSVGGENSGYSEEFRNAAQTEKEEILKRSNACHQIVRERG